MTAQPSAREIMGLLELPGVGPARVRRLLAIGGGGRLGLLDEGLLSQVLSEAQMRSLPEARERSEREWSELERVEGRLLSLADSDYPPVLRSALDRQAPMLLYCRGNLQLLCKPAVGFCGSRKASEKGIQVAGDTAGLLAEAGVNVVSGFASGVDMAAHRAALRSGGTTTAVLAEGMLHYRIKREIREEWDENRTLVVSEFPPSVRWSVGRAMQRNATICGLSRAMVLIEARARGGSYEAGRKCLEMGLPLFAAVYEGMPEPAAGNEELLRQGARRLMKSRSSGRTNVQPVLQAIRPEAPAATVA